MLKRYFCLKVAILVTRWLQKSRRNQLFIKKCVCILYACVIIMFVCMYVRSVDLYLTTGNHQLLLFGRALLKLSMPSSQILLTVTEV